ncbi:NAD(P)/FAD-dependent oxidoreductase [Halegenticoccus tardaugens]|uniref:NAD(P)/FAD-dependent oxidoreductase n=1 Tax=Halegenticoccus tardaugens TaxID=2071624 RepID=UPI00100AE606|nr:FAD-dependent oxidoreductase [Halegenticoccus tardaugens]
MTQREYDAVVVGGGIVGSAAAYHLARGGTETLLLDREDAGRATDAGAGIVTTGTEQRDGPDDWYRFAADAMAYYPALADRLEADGCADHSYRRRGMLQVAVTPDERDALAAARERAERRTDRFGHPPDGSVDRLDPDEATELFPPLSDVEAALHYRDAAQVDGRRFERALRTAGERRGLDVRNEAATGVRLADDGAVVGVETERGGHDAPSVVIAGGAWSPAFAADLGVDLPVEPLRGQIVHLDCADFDADPDAWPIVGGFRHHYVAPWAEGRVAVGATRERGVGFSATPTLGGLDEVTAEALRLAPGLADATYLETRVGLRPATPDDLPIVGPVPGVPGAYVATGHGATGLQLGPYSGKAVADLIAGGNPVDGLAAFAVDRFD